MNSKKAVKHPPKFKTVFLKKSAPADPRLETLKFWCRVFHESGLAPSYGLGSHGNLSFRLKPGENKFIITASAIRLKNKMTRRCFFKVTRVDIKKNSVRGVGVRRPSSESFLHYAIYKKRKDVNTIFHGHCPRILKLARRLGIPETPTEEPYGTPALAEGVRRILDDQKFLIMKNHGFISLGRDFKEAGRRALKILEKW
ncbi:MAG TPA: class II aldolase/adducin family protein [Candidatus Paceibacterota bacterium]